MSRTSCKAEMKFIDVTALEDAELASSDNQEFGNLNLFLKESNQSDYATLELNRFLLDGSKNIMNGNPDDVGFWSKEKSDSSCSFTTHPSIDISFSTIHSSSGITLYFAEEYPVAVKLTWYTLAGTKLESETYYPDSMIYFCEKQVTNYGKLKIEILETQFPECYARIQYLLYGVLIEWNEDVIKEAKVNEEIDITSSTLPINTADVSIVDETNDFDIGNEDGSWKSIQKSQEINLTEVIDGEEIACGTFFMNDWSFSGNVASFSLIDLLGLMDKYTFESGTIYSSIKAGVIIDAIFASCGITKYTVEEEVYNTILSGYLAIQTCREALQMVVFACGAVADCSRSDTVKIYKPDRYVSYTIGTDRKFYGNTSVELAEYVSGVAITCNKYSLESESSEIYNDVLSVGTTKIQFTEPYLASSISVSGGTLTEVKTNYVVVSMNTTGTCVITGRKYSKNEFTYQKNVDYIESGETENVKSFGTCTLYNASGLSDLAEWLLNYYKLRKVVKMKYIMQKERVGNWCNIRDTNGKTATTLIENQEVDLAGGFVSDAVCRGYSIVITENYYAGSDLYMGGDEII